MVLRSLQASMVIILNLISMENEEFIWITHDKSIWKFLVNDLDTIKWVDSLEEAENFFREKWIKFYNYTAVIRN